MCEALDSMGRSDLRNFSSGRVVPEQMSPMTTRVAAPTLTWIWIGVGLFLIALAGSAFIIPGLRLLHLLQALIYVAIILLARRNSPWGYGAGVTIAVLWNALGLFVTHLMQAGLGELWSLLRTGQVKRPDTLMVFVGGVGHFILIVACLAAMFHRDADKRRWWKFAGGGVLALAYFALIVAVARPR
jgi:hypothetical protein